MTTHIVLLRAVNLAGRNSVGMADLRGLLAELGMEDVHSLLQSGNLVFRSETRNTTQLERTLQRAAARRLGLETDFFVRTAAELKTIITDNPFPKEAANDPGHLLVMFLKGSPASQDVGALQKAIAGREVVRVKGRHAYIVYPDGIGRSRLTTALVEKKLGTKVTGRNWNTILKLEALSGRL